MGRFKLGSTVINLFAPGKVNLVEQLESLSVTKIGQPLAVSTRNLCYARRCTRPTSCWKRIEAGTRHSSPLVDDKRPGLIHQRKR